MIFLQINFIDIFSLKTLRNHHEHKHQIELQKSKK
jgi:hypothetical protein